MKHDNPIIHLTPKGICAIIKYTKICFKELPWYKKPFHYRKYKKELKKLNNALKSR